MASNYFKTRGHMFFFTDTIPESIEAAWVAASYFSALVSVYKPIPVDGPWKSAMLIGDLKESTLLA